MANVHTLNDYNNTQANQGGGNYSRNYSYGQQTSDAPPRCIDVVFPGFTLYSFVLWISAVQIIIYIVSITLGSTTLSPTISSLLSLGASYGPPVVHGQVWRFLTPIFLHAGFWHLAFNVFFQCRMGFPLERQFGWKKIAVAYVICALSGNLFSIALAPCKVAVGASTAGFGLIGIQMAEIMLTWHLLQQKEHVIFNIAFFVMMSVLISLNPSSVVDWRGHLGGFIAGLGLGVIYNDISQSLPVWYQTGKMASYIGISALMISCLGVIYGIPLATRGC